jgi:hypothetical protein
VRELVRDDRLGLASGFHRARIQQDHRPHQTPADRGSQIVAGEQRGAVLEAHAPLCARQSA